MRRRCRLAPGGRTADAAPGLMAGLGVDPIQGAVGLCRLEAYPVWDLRHAFDCRSEG